MSLWSHQVDWLEQLLPPIKSFHHLYCHGSVSKECYGVTFEKPMRDSNFERDQWEKYEIWKTTSYSSWGQSLFFFIAASASSRSVLFPLQCFWSSVSSGTKIGSKCTFLLWRATTLVRCSHESHGRKEHAQHTELFTSTHFDKGFCPRTLTECHVACTGMSHFSCPGIAHVTRTLFQPAVCRTY